MRIVLLFLLVLGFISCAKKVEHQVQEPSLFDQICEIENRRHGEHATVEIYRNIYTDQYLEEPGDPKEILKYMEKEASGTCRGALLQVFIRAHTTYFFENQKPLFKKFTKKDKQAVLMAIRLYELEAFDQLIFHFLDGKEDFDLRESASIALATIDQSKYIEEIKTLLNKEKDPEILASLLLSIDTNIDEFNREMVVLMDHPDEAIHKRVMSLWSSAEFPQKKAYLAKYKEHKNPKVAKLAESFIETLGDRPKMTMTMSASGMSQSAYTEVMDLKLEEALYNGRADVALTFFDSGTHINVVDEDGYSPLIISAQRGPNWFMDELLQRGANVNWQNKDGVTAIILAAMYGNAYKVESLLKYGADPTIQDNVGRTAISIAEMMEKEKIVKLLQGERPNLEPFYEAIRKNDLKTLLDYLGNEQDPNHPDKTGMTPLMMAAEIGSERMTRELLKWGANPHAKDYMGLRAHLLAIGEGHTKVAAIIEQAMKEKEGSTTLFGAIVTGDMETFKKGLVSGIDLNTKNRSDDTPLALAIRYNRPEMVKLLLAKGAKHTGSPRYDVLAYAKLWEREEIVAIVEAHFAETN